MGILLTGCLRSDYTKLVEDELGKGERQDSLFLGFHFSDTRNEFYGKCYDLNKSQVLVPGPSGTVLYAFTDSSVHKTPIAIHMLFVPAFDANEKITNIDLNFSYPGWAQWNRPLQADSLEEKVKKLLMLWYGGNSFILADVGGKKIPVKLDGNRRIVIYREEPKNVIVKLQDILHPKFMHSVTSDTIRQKNN